MHLNKNENKLVNKRILFDLFISSIPTSIKSEKKKISCRFEIILWALYRRMTIRKGPFFWRLIDQVSIENVNKS